MVRKNVNIEDILRNTIFIYLVVKTNKTTFGFFFQWK